MLGTYASLLLLLGGAALVGQALCAAFGQRRLSALAPAVGLAALCALAWWTVRLPGEGSAAIVSLAIASAISAGVLWRRPPAVPERSRAFLVVAVAAVVLGSLPFLVEGRFGILGTGLNPDMSQHLFAADRLAAGASERLIAEGYPLGPHALVVAITELGPSPVQAFDGLMLAVAVASCLAPVALLARVSGWRLVGGALVIGFAYLVASSYVQGSFKETMQALFVVSFAIGLLELGSDRGAGAVPGLRRALPLAVLAAGTAYVYSFPGLLWLAGTLAAWALVTLALRRRAPGGIGAAVRAAVPAGVAALALFTAAIVPELGRMADFAQFETFDPDRAGLGNLFNRLSPLEALGIWPSGDFRVEPGGGAVPAALFYLGGAAGLAALGFGLGWWCRRGEHAVSAALCAAAVLWLYALLAGTAYQEAKALVVLAPLVALISFRAVLSAAPALLAIALLAAAGGRACSCLPTARSGRAALATARRARAATRRGLDRRLRAGGAARRPARSRLPRLGAARSPRLRRGGPAGARRARPGNRDRVSRHLRRGGRGDPRRPHRSAAARGRAAGLPADSDGARADPAKAIR